MNWKLILQLSLLGLAMGIATVFFIPGRFEPLFWLVVLGITAYVIATRVVSQRFLHGLWVGIVNGVWVTGAHVLLFGRYLANHPKEAAMMTSMPLQQHPRLMMICVGLGVGVVSGVVIGLVALLVGKMIRPQSTASVAAP